MFRPLLRLQPPLHPQITRRIWTLSTTPPLILAPVVFTGLTLTLWSYKCLMMILFQSRIIYMPGIPLGARTEKISDYSAYCRGIRWKEGKIHVDDGTVLATASATVNNSREKEKELVVVYFQGNASSTPPRLPRLSSILASLPCATTMVIPSYRGYWFSTGRPSQRGIERDLAAIFKHLREDFGGADKGIVLWGQSIGCGILMEGLAKYPLPNVTALVLETPFVSIEEMLKALYPQKWLPYRYLGWALWNRWELLVALKRILSRGWRGQVLVLQAGGDELVPAEQAGKIAEFAREAGVPVAEEKVEGALHVECMAKPRGRKAVVDFLGRIHRDIQWR